MFDLQIDGAVARLHLNRPEARNAISANHWSVLASAVDEAERAGARILLLMGAGSAFCAGADLSDFKGLRDDAKARVRFRQAMREALDRLAGVPMPTVAIIEGACFGAGVALAMACDIRIAGSGASFGLPPAKLGLSYPQEDIHALVALIGPGQAARLLFGGGTIDGAEAARIGLVQQYETGDATGAAESLSAAILSNSASSLATLKRGIGLAARGSAQDEMQDRSFDAAFASDELAERLSRLRKRS